MYKVFLVDDEIEIREGMRDSINWGNINFVFSGEAPDGEMALPLIQEVKPDVLITDIKMPFMDGLQLSRMVHKMMPWVKIVILTGHDEFHYAKEAISIGVAEFLLKPVCATELTEVLKKIAAKIEQEKKEEETSEKLKVQLQNNMAVLRERFLNELVTGMVSLQDVVDKCEHFQIDIISKYYLVTIMEAETKVQNMNDCKYREYLKFEEVVDKILKGNKQVIKFKRNVGELILIIKGDGDSTLSAYAYDLSETIKNEAEKDTYCTLSISIGSVMERLGGIAKSYLDADFVNKYKYIYGKGKILGMNDLKLDLGIKEFIKLDMNNINDFMKYGSYKDIRQFVDDYVKHLDRTGMNSLIYIFYTYIYIMLNASKFVKELGWDIEKILPEAVQLQNDLSIINSVDKFREHIESVLRKVLECRENRMEDRYSDIMGKAKDFITNHFRNPNLSLNSVASYVNMSPNHFCSVFSQEAGETFTEYLTKVRLKKAKELLKTTSLRAAEIAYGVGYNDPHYFSYIFKKWEGVTPKEFRSS